ncbi:MAG: hypothetical protein Q9166_003814 [cf. Caloplaca sp. 2 TL-2023]
MTGTFIITGANGSLAIPAIESLLSTKPDCTLICTVRNASDTDANTEKLRTTLSHFTTPTTSIRELDLSSLPSVQEFAKTIAAEISNGKLPALSAIICNAYYWNLNKPVEFTSDGYEKTFQVSHLAHAALVLRLLGTFGPTGGRIVLFSSDTHWPGKNGLEKYPPTIPEYLDDLVKPATDAPVDNTGRGFQRYANSKLAIVMWMYALNRALEKDPSLSKITAVAINPGTLSDSRALRTNTPAMLFYLSKFVIGPLQPLLRFMDPTMRTSAEAGKDVIQLATNEAYPGDRGYFTMLKKDESSPESRDEAKQERLWVKTAEWAGVEDGDTALGRLNF